MWSFCRKAIQAWLDRRARGIYTDSLITAEGGTASVHQRRARAAERFRRAGMPERAVKLAMTREEPKPQPKPTGRTRRWHKKPCILSEVSMALSLGTDDGQPELPTVPPIEPGPTVSSIAGYEEVV
jgi:hypothetical protein